MAKLNLTLCAGPGCDRPAKLKGLCQSHYMQLRRGNPLTPLQTPASERGIEYPAQVTFRCSDELKERVQKEAARAGIEEAEWWRRAGDRALRLDDRREIEDRPHQVPTSPFRFSKKPQR